ncbi:hypothetical protein E3N88_30404 [Mikania micrantha]|uniref:Uncharacterized protein n=1 Tax=Mikania micrantha TaxID=192012 RepID=A0A5N6MLQ0_9ASTR|nr:hypothetical protein E3N88_30404 [Mikania micrantha]
MVVNWEFEREWVSGKMSGLQDANEDDKMRANMKIEKPEDAINGDLIEGERSRGVVLKKNAAVAGSRKMSERKVFVVVGEERSSSESRGGRWRGLERWRGASPFI